MLNAREVVARVKQRNYPSNWNVYQGTDSYSCESGNEPARITPEQMARFTWEVGELVPVERKKKVRKRNVPMTNIAGCLFGSAFGDALAADTEFLSVQAILSRYPNGPQDLQGNPALVTDDTQMALAVGKALTEAKRPYTAMTLEEPLRRAFVDWSKSPDNNRTPGIRCMQACAKLASGMPWQQATVIQSKGCGANMRVAPVGLLGNILQATRAALAQFQTALTHGHPTDLAAADLTAFAIADLVAGGDPAGLPKRLREYALDQRRVYHEDWLGLLWQGFRATSAEEFISQRWYECLQVLERLDSALQVMDRESDPCLATGASWIAEEALATGLLCFLRQLEQDDEFLEEVRQTHPRISYRELTQGERMERIGQIFNIEPDEKGRYNRRKFIAFYQDRGMFASAKGCDI